MHRSTSKLLPAARGNYSYFKFLLSYNGGQDIDQYLGHRLIFTRDSMVAEVLIKATARSAASGDAATGVKISMSAC